MIGTIVPNNNFMSMSIYVVGFRPADAKWKKMKHIYDACVTAGVSIPEEVDKFFDNESPGDKPGKEIGIDTAVTEYNAEMCEGFEVDITKLPSDVKIIRFYNSY